MKVGFAGRKYGSVHFKRKTLHLHFRAWWKYLSTHSSKTWCEWGRIAESSLKKLWLKREIARCNPVYSSFDKLRKNNESLRKKFNFIQTTILKHIYQINLSNQKTCYMQINCTRLSHYLHMKKKELIWYHVLLEWLWWSEYWQLWNSLVYSGNIQ